MKTRNLLATGFAASVLALAAAPAHAAPVGWSSTNNTFLGNFSTTFPLNGFSFGVNNTQLAAGAAFMHTWIFNLNPTAFTEFSYSYTPSAGISDFTANIFNASDFVCAVVAGSSCGTVGTIGSLALGTTSLPPPFSSLGLGSSILGVGQYAFQISGKTAVGITNANYTGNVSLNAVPEPGSLALLGLGLAGLAAATRRKQKQA